jgi:hypothetical protein
MGFIPIIAVVTIIKICVKPHKFILQGIHLIYDFIYLLLQQKLKSDI